MTPVISVENLSKSYRLGQIGTGTLSRDLSVWWARMRSKPNPLLKIGQEDKSSLDGETLWALRDVSFQVEQGEVLGIIGRNGAGKSTLLKILSRVTAPTSGRVKVKGRIASLLEVGTGFHPELTGRENVYLNGAILGMTREEVTRKFDEIVDFAGVEKFIDTPVKRYSSGMYVRLAFAVAAHLEPEILLVDEVLAVGDAEFQKKCLGTMGNVAKQGRTVLFVSHNMAAVQAICKSGLLLTGGKVEVLGEISSIIYSYQTSTEVSQTTESKNDSNSIDIINLRINHTNNYIIYRDKPFCIRFSLLTNIIIKEYVIICSLRDTDNKIIVHSKFAYKDSNYSIASGRSDIKIDYPALWLRTGVYSLEVKLILDLSTGPNQRFVSTPQMVEIVGDSPEISVGLLNPNVSWSFNHQS